MSHFLLLTIIFFLIFQPPGLLLQKLPFILAFPPCLFGVVSQSSLRCYVPEFSFQNVHWIKHSSQILGCAPPLPPQLTTGRELAVCGGVCGLSAGRKPILTPCWKLFLWLAFIIIIIHNDLPRGPCPLLDCKPKCFCSAQGEIVCPCPLVNRRD